MKVYEKVLVAFTSKSMSNRTTKITPVSTGKQWWTPFSSKFGMVKLFKSLKNAVDHENLLIETKIFK